MQGYIWDSEFSTKFAKQYWEQRPCVFDYPAKQAIANLDELFHAVVNMPSRGPSDRFWVAKSVPPKRYDDFRNIQGEGINLFGPKADDGNLMGFFERMNGRHFGFNSHKLGAGLPVIDERMKAIVLGLQQAGLPLKPQQRGWVSDTFFGTYHATPFGIHRDPASVFSLTLLGERTYYTWPMDYFPLGHKDLQCPDNNAIKRHIPNAEVFKLSPGKVFYWPSNRWHVATSNGQPTAVVQMSTYFDSKDVNQA